MTNLINLAVGQPYPLPKPLHEGAAANFLQTDSNTLVVYLSGMDAAEEYALKKGNIQAAILTDNGNIILIFQFLGRRKEPVLTLDCPFDARLIPSDIRQLHSITNSEQRLAIEVHAIDERIIRGLRLVTMPPDMTLEFLSAVQDQLAVPKKPEPAAWMQYQPHELFKKAQKKYYLGE